MWLSTGDFLIESHSLKAQKFRLHFVKGHVWRDGTEYMQGLVEQRTKPKYKIAGWHSIKEQHNIPNGPGIQMFFYIDRNNTFFLIGIIKIKVQVCLYHGWGIKNSLVSILLKATCRESNSVM